MKKYMRPTNKGETHCCSLKDIKLFFKNTNINVSFDFASKSFNPYIFRVEKYVKEKIKGIIICYLNSSTRNDEAWLCCNVIKESEYSDDMRQKFVEECLPKLFGFYKKHLIDQSLIRKEVIMLIELLENKFIIHEITTPRQLSG